MTDQAANFTGSVPENYDRYLGPRIFNAYAEELCNRAAALRPESVLELAAGTGILTRRLRDTLPAHTDIVATDLNLPMLEVAKGRFQADENVRFETADATDLSYAAGEFDQVVCQFGIMFFPDKEQSFAEAYRLLRPGGSYLFNVWGSLTTNPFARIAHEAVVDMFPDNPPGFYKVPFSYHDADVIKAALLNAGFARVEFDTQDMLSPVGSALDFARGLVFGNPLEEEIVMRDGDPEEVCTAIAAALESDLSEEMPLQAHFIRADRG